MALFDRGSLAARIAAARKEIRDGYVQYLGNEVEPAACHTTCTIFISSHLFSGDPDFSPLVSKLRENAKTVIGIGVKKSTSDLFISNCDEFIYYDDLVRVEPAKKRPSATPSTRNVRPSPDKDHGSGPSIDGALDLLTRTLEALRAERGEDYPIRGSLVKQAIKRQNPGFNERAHGFRAFNELLLEAQKRGLLKLEDDKQAGTYIVHASE